MADSTDMIMPMLREMRAEMNTRFDGVNRRLEALENAQASFKQPLAADTLLGRLLTGEFEQPIEALEEKMDRLERRS